MELGVCVIASIRELKTRIKYATFDTAAHVSGDYIYHHRISKFLAIHRRGSGWAKERP